jgi:hypothetical protein
MRRNMMGFDKLEAAIRHAQARAPEPNRVRLRTDAKRGKPSWAQGDDTQ